MRWRMIFGATAVVLLTATVIFFRTRRVPEAPAGASFPRDVDLQNLQGKKISSEQFNGTPLVVLVWASWCPFCREEISFLSNAEKESGGTFRVILVNRGENTETAFRFLETIANFATSTPVLFNPTDSLYKAIHGFSMPETLFIDKKGVIRYEKHGRIEYIEIKRRIEDLIEADRKL